MSAHRAGRLEEANGLYRSAIQADPGDSRALRLRGVLSRDLGDVAASARYLARAADVAPLDAEPLAELAITRMAAGDLEGAESALRDALRREPEHGKALANLGALLQYRGHVAEALDFHRRALEQDPDDPEVRCNLAKALAECGRGEDALAACNEALSRAPAHPLLLAAKGAVLCDVAQFDAAIPVLESAVVRYPDDDMALVNLAYARTRVGAHDAAIEALHGAIRANPSSGRATADLVNLLAGTGRVVDALALAMDFLERHAGERQVLAAQAFALRDAGREQEAVALLDFDRLILVSDLTPPQGYASLEEFNARLRAAIEADPSLLASPASKATRGGSQTGELRFGHDAVFRAFRAMVDEAVAAAARGLEAAGLASHPAMAYASPRWALRAWGTVIESGGRQAPHIHPLGWLSGVYYAAVPADMRAAGPQAGWIEFGAPPDRFVVKLPPPPRAVEPRAGRLVVFPSYLYHRTLPFESAERRISVAFDVVPL